MRAISLAVFLDAMRGSHLLDRSDVERSSCRSGNTLGGSNAIRRRTAPRTTISSASWPVSSRSASSCPSSAAAEDFLARGLAGLERKPSARSHGDGTSVEQAFRYHLFVLDHLLVVVALLDAARTSVPASRSSMRSREAVVRLRHSSASPIPSRPTATPTTRLRFGLTEVVCARLAELRRVSPRGSAIAHARVAATALDVTACWLFGEEGAERFARDRPGTGAAIRCARAMRASSSCGPLGAEFCSTRVRLGTCRQPPTAMPTLCRLRSQTPVEDLVVDPGVGSYFGDPVVRAALRGTAAHATVTIDGADQSEAGGAFLWTRHASARLISVDIERGQAVGRHDGYRLIPAPVAHRRLVRVDGQEPIVVVDRLESGAVHEVVQSWPLHPDLDAVLEGGVVRATHEGRPRLLIAVQGTSAGRLGLLRGEREPFRGWYSRRLEHVEPAWLASWSATAGASIDIVALIWPLSGDKWPEPGLQIVSRGTGSRSATGLQGRRGSSRSDRPIGQHEGVPARLLSRSPITLQRGFLPHPDQWVGKDSPNGGVGPSRKFPIGARALLIPPPKETS